MLDMSKSAQWDPLSSLGSWSFCDTDLIFRFTCQLLCWALKCNFSISSTLVKVTVLGVKFLWDPVLCELWQWRASDQSWVQCSGYSPMGRFIAVQSPDTSRPFLLRLFGWKLSQGLPRALHNNFISFRTQPNDVTVFVPQHSSVLCLKWHSRHHFNRSNYQHLHFGFLF